MSHTAPSTIASVVDVVIPLVLNTSGIQAGQLETTLLINLALNPPVQRNISVTLIVTASAVAEQCSLGEEQHQGSVGERVIVPFTARDLEAFEINNGSERWTNGARKLPFDVVK